MQGGSHALSIVIVPGCGTRELAGISGKLTLD